MTVVEPLHRTVSPETPAWVGLKGAVSALRPMQQRDGSLAPDVDRAAAGSIVERMRRALADLAPAFPHDAAYLAAVDRDLAAWLDGGFGVPDFAGSLSAFQ